MNSRNYFILALLIPFFLGCVKNKHADSPVESINIDPHRTKEFVYLSEIADSIKCIKLKTGTKEVMGRVREIIIKKKHIYAMDISQQILFVFDKEGRLISKLDKKGEAPDEYTRMGPFFVDEDEKYVELVNFKGAKTSILKYSNIDFKLIETSPFPDLRYNSCKKNSGIYYFASQQFDNIIDGKKTNADLLIFDKKKTISKLFDKSIETNSQYFSPNGESFTQNDKKQLFVSFLYNNTFYRLDGKNAYPAFTVDFGKYGMNNSIGRESTKKQMEYIEKMNGVASFPVLNIENRNILSFSYYFKENSNSPMFSEKDFRQYIKFKKSNKTYNIKAIKNDITDFPKQIYISSYFFNCIHEVWYENYLVDIVLPEFYFKDGMDKAYVEGVGEITPDDNPVVVMFKIKKDL